MWHVRGGDVRVDGQRIKVFTLGGRNYGAFSYTETEDIADSELHVRFPAKAGMRTVGIAFNRDQWYVEGVGMSRLPPASDGYASGRKTELAYGRVNPDDHGETFCMTVLALKLSRRANGVSSLHGQVSRAMWQPLYPGRHEEEVPIGHITNGVHVPTFLAQEWADVFERYGADAVTGEALPHRGTVEEGAPEAADLMRALRADVPIFLASGFSEDESMRRYGDKGIAGFLQKPYTREVIETKIRESAPGLLTEIAAA